MESLQQDEVQGYTLLPRVLGVGTFGTVWLGKDGEDAVAIKAFHKPTIADMRAESFVDAEVAMAAALPPCPNCVRCLSVQHSEQHTVIVMPFLAGGSLSDRLRAGGGRLPEPLAKQVTAQLVTALSHIHRAGFVYRDVKPDNVMFTHTGQVQVVDFGLSTRQSPSLGGVSGQPEFMAPEMLRRERYTEAVDWWALGVLVYVMLTGRKPFPGGSVLEVQASLNDKNHAPLDAMAAGAAKDFVSGLLTRSAPDRLQFAARVAEHAWIAGTDVATPLWVPPVRDAFDTSLFPEHEVVEEGGATAFKVIGA